MAILRIVKRTGEVVPFDRARIRAAVAKAIRAVGAESSALASTRSSTASSPKSTRASPTSSPTVENIQDIVEKQLVREGLYEIAKAYILYRADRQRERDAKRARRPSSGPASAGSPCGRATGATCLFNLKRCEASVARLAAISRRDVSVDARRAARRCARSSTASRRRRSSGRWCWRPPRSSSAIRPTASLAARLQLEALFRR